MNTNRMQIFTGTEFFSRAFSMPFKVLFTFQTSRAQTTQTGEAINDCKQQKEEL